MRSLVIPLFLVMISKPLYSQSGGDQFAGIWHSEQFAYFESKNLVKGLDELNTERILSVYDECWDHNKLNPYHDIKVKHPFHVSFEDSMYAAPIHRAMVVTSRYGLRAGQSHHGIDIDLITGDLVMAMLPGKVRLVGYVRGMGNTVIVRHSNGLETIYGHLSKMSVMKNQEVTKGQVLGRGGTTGNARGSHLHLEVRYRGESINPEYLFDFSESGKILETDRWVNSEWTNPRKHHSTKKSKIHKHGLELKAAHRNVGSGERPRVSSNERLVEKKQPNSLTKRRSIPVLNAPDLGEDLTYTVQSGDTLYSIAKRYRVGIDVILANNGIGSDFVIKVGQSLYLGD